MARGLTAKQQAFVAAYIGPARGNASEAARQAGYSVRGSAIDVLANPIVRGAIDAWRAEVKAQGIAQLEQRVSRLAEMERRYWQVIEERAADLAEETAGGSTGLIVRTIKLSSTGDQVTEYQADTAVTKEIRAIYEDVAKELGQRVDKIEHGGGIRRELVIVPPETTLPVSDE